jgi:hypothetical protein
MRREQRRMLDESATARHDAVSSGAAVANSSAL